MTKIFYDTEFIEDGATIDLVSIGMVCEDGRELYAVSSEFNVDKLHRNPWLIENVWPSLPKVGNMRCRCIYGHFDQDHPDVYSRRKIARLVSDFIAATRDPELWAWYGAYDHVALCWLWGPMTALPRHVPMWTNDLRQECQRLGNPRVPEQVAGAHHALADARQNRVIAEFLASRT